MKDHARSDLYTRDPLHDEFRSYRRLWFSYIFLSEHLFSITECEGIVMAFSSPEQELTIKIADVDSIHINDMNVLESS